MDDEPGARIEQPSLVDLAAEKIRELLLAGTLTPGERVREEWLSSRLGISRPPLREAIRVLVHQGLLERMPRRGVRVVSLTEDDIRDIYSLRSVLDRFALELGVPAADPAMLEPLRAAVAVMRAAAESGRHAPYVEANRQFHLALIRLGENSRLTMTYELLMNQMQLLMSVNLSRESAEDKEIGVRRHEELLRAIESGSLEQALAALAAHGERRFLAVEGAGGAGGGETRETVVDGGAASRREAP
ncbi:MAG TPA: GntR family transcriptional regulator [Solirubrobacteraceae bacterium]|nr:GntR family transcriptional regulator [Solirubrobacteraceae bacterium]